MAKSGKYFMYNNKTSLDWGLIMCDLDDSADDIPMGLQRDIDKGNTNKYKLVANHFGTNYSEVLEFDIHVMKNPYEKTSQDDLKFSRNEVREISAWLTQPTTPVYLQVADDDGDEDENIEYCGLFSNIESFVYGNMYGLKLTFTCNCSFGFSKLNTFTYACAKDTTIYVGNDSDEVNDYVYPVLIIEPKENGTIQIINHTDNDGNITINTLADSAINMDCRKLKLYDESGVLSISDTIADGVADMYWLRLVHGKNKIQVIGNCILKVQFREYRKVGAY